MSCQKGELCWDAPSNVVSRGCTVQIWGPRHLFPDLLRGCCMLRALCWPLSRNFPWWQEGEGATPELHSSLHTKTWLKLWLQWVHLGRAIWGLELYCNSTPPSAQSQCPYFFTGDASVTVLSELPSLSLRTIFQGPRSIHADKLTLPGFASWAGIYCWKLWFLVGSLLKVTHSLYPIHLTQVSFLPAPSSTFQHLPTLRQFPFWNAWKYIFTSIILGHGRQVVKS